MRGGLLALASLGALALLAATAYVGRRKEFLQSHEAVTVAVRALDEFDGGFDLFSGKGTVLVLVQKLEEWWRGRAVALVTFMLGGSALMLATVLRRLGLKEAEGDVDKYQDADGQFHGIGSWDGMLGLRLAE